MKNQKELDISKIMFSPDQDTLEEAILADIVSGIPIVGDITDFIRASKSDTERKRAMQILDTITGPIPIISQLTFTNTALFLDKTGEIDLSFIDNIAKAFDVTRK